MMKKILMGSAAAIVLAVATAPAKAGDVSLSIGFGGYPFSGVVHLGNSPRYRPPPAYYAPPPAYYAPEPIYYAPPPVYVPSAVYRPAPVYVAPPRRYYEPRRGDGVRSAYRTGYRHGYRDGYAGSWR